MQFVQYVQFVQPYLPSLYWSLATTALRLLSMAGNHYYVECAADSVDMPHLIRAPETTDGDRRKPARGSVPLGDMLRVAAEQGWKILSGRPRSSIPCHGARRETTHT